MRRSAISLLLLWHVADASAFVDSAIPEFKAGQFLNEYFGEIVASLVVVLIAWVFAIIPKIFSAIAERYRMQNVSAYVKASSFDETEILDGLRNYIKPKCMESDPSAEIEPRDALSKERRPLFAEIDQIISKGEHRHIFVLADSGMGKTSFLINYFYTNKTRWRGKRNMRLVSLARDGANAEIDETPTDVRRKTVLLLDSFDEDSGATVDAKARLDGLLAASEDYKAVIIGCRSQFFLKDESIPVRSGMLRVGPTKASLSKEYSIARVYIAPFDDKEVRRYIRGCFPSPLQFRLRSRAERVVDKVPLLTVRPMLLAHISDVMATEAQARTQADIYDAMVKAWAIREDHWIKQTALIEFSKALAYDFYSNRSVRGGEFCSIDELDELLRMWKVEVGVDRLTGRSLLNRFGDGNIKFSHRSILEFFVAQVLLTAPVGVVTALTDQMGVFLLEMLGVPTGLAERVAKERVLSFRVVAPVQRLGFPTNFGLYRALATKVESASVFRVAAFFAGDSSEISTLGEIVLGVAKYARSGELVDEVRLVVPNCEKDSAWVDCYLSAWFQEALVVSHVLVDARELLSAIGDNEVSVGEIVLVGVPRFNELTSLRWTRQSRCDFIDGHSIQVRELERQPNVSYLYDESRRGLEIGFVSGGLTPGPLARFGLMDGGSAAMISKLKYIRVGKRSF